MQDKTHLNFYKLDHDCTVKELLTLLQHPSPLIQIKAEEGKFYITEFVSPTGGVNILIQNAQKGGSGGSASKNSISTPDKFGSIYD